SRERLQEYERRGRTGGARHRPAPGSRGHRSAGGRSSGPPHTRYARRPNLQPVAGAQHVRTVRRIRAKAPGRQAAPRTAAESRPPRPKRAMANLTATNGIIANRSRPETRVCPGGLAFRHGELWAHSFTRNNSGNPLDPSFGTV